MNRFSEEPTHQKSSCQLGFTLKGNSLLPREQILFQKRSSSGKQNGSHKMRPPLKN